MHPRNATPEPHGADHRLGSRRMAASSLRIREAPLKLEFSLCSDCKESIGSVRTRDEWLKHARARSRRHRWPNASDLTCADRDKANRRGRPALATARLDSYA